jgi:predicted enzyme related to lactoylglutathione lyase
MLRLRLDGGLTAMTVQESAAEEMARSSTPASLPRGEACGRTKQEQRSGTMSDAPYRIDYLEFPSADGGLGTRRFFAEAFGWKFIDYGPTYHAIVDAGIDAGIQGAADEAAAAPLAVIHTDDLDRAQRQVERAGGVVTRQQFDFPGGRRFHFREPGGNELAVWVEKTARSE